MAEHKSVNHRPRVAIIGTGVSALGAASTLWPNCDLVLYEKGSHVGGHAMVQKVHVGASSKSNENSVDVDCGFMVFNHVTYPNMIRWFQQHGVEIEESDMSFGVSVDKGSGPLEWASTGLQALYAQKSNFVNPQFQRMVYDLYRFQGDALSFLSTSEVPLPKDVAAEFPLYGKSNTADNDTTTTATTSSSTEVSDGSSASCDVSPSSSSPSSLRRRTSSPCSTSSSSSPSSSSLSTAASSNEAAGYSGDAHALTMREFLHTRGYGQYFVDYYIAPVLAAVWSVSTSSAMDFPAQFILQFFRNHHLLQLTGRPQWYTIKGRSKQGYIDKVTAPFRDSIRLNTPVVKVEPFTSDSSTKVRVTAKGEYSGVEVFDHVIFGCHAPDVLNILGDKASSDERTILSSFGYQNNDVYLHRDARLMPKNHSCWAAWNFLGGSCVTYNLNRLQNLEVAEQEAKDFPILITLNPPHDKVPRPDLVVKRMKMDHPIPTARSVHAQGQLTAIQGQPDRHLWFCGAYQGYGFHEDGLVSGLKVGHSLLGITWQACALNKHMTVSLTQMAPRWCVHNFLSSFVQKGYVTLQEVGGSLMTFGSEPQESLVPSSEKQAHLVVKDARFYTAVFFRGDLGLADAYVEDYVECSDWVQFLLLLLDNRDLEQSAHGRVRYTCSGLVGSLIGRVTATLKHRLRANTPSQSRTNIHQHYDLGNDFFELFLDRSMTYSSAFWNSQDDTLEQAQINKLQSLIDKAHIQPGNRVLEIGFGWGSLSRRIAKTTGCHVTGLTLSEEQLKWAEEKATEEGLSHLLDYQLVDYRVFAKSKAGDKQEKFDRILSCEMLEAVGHEFLGDFYFHCDRLLNDDGLMVVQVITYPDDTYEEYRDSVDFIREKIFPGGLCPSFHALTDAMKRNSTFVVQHMENRPIDYAYTLARWRQKYHESRDFIERKFSPEFFRMWDYYFVYCQAGFASRSLGLLQVQYARPKNPYLKSTATPYSLVENASVVYPEHVIIKKLKQD